MPGEGWLDLIADSAQTGSSAASTDQGFSGFLEDTADRFGWADQSLKAFRLLLHQYPELDPNGDLAAEITLLELQLNVVEVGLDLTANYYGAIKAGIDTEI